jgi:hypothetical protein
LALYGFWSLVISFYSRFWIWNLCRVQCAHGNMHLLVNNGPLGKHYENKRCFAIGLVIQLQLCQNNSFSTTMQLQYNYTYDVMLTSLIVIHLLKSNTWHYEVFWT